MGVNYSSSRQWHFRHEPGAHTSARLSPREETYRSSFKPSQIFSDSHNDITADLLRSTNVQLLDISRDQERIKDDIKSLKRHKQAIRARSGEYDLKEALPQDPQKPGRDIERWRAETNERKCNAIRGEIASLQRSISKLERRVELFVIHVSKRQADSLFSLDELDIAVLDLIAELEVLPRSEAFLTLLPRRYNEATFRTRPSNIFRTSFEDWHDHVPDTRVAESPKRVDAATVIVQYISAQTKDWEIRDHFTSCGPIADIRYITNNDDTKSAAVTFSQIKAQPEQAAKDACLLLDRTSLGTSCIHVTPAVGLTAEELAGYGIVLSPTPRECEVARIKAGLAECGNAGLKAGLAELRRQRARRAKHRTRLERNPFKRNNSCTDDEEELDEEEFKTRVAHIQRIQVRVAELRGGLVGSEEVYTKRFKAALQKAYMSGASQS